MSAPAANLVFTDVTGLWKVMARPHGAPPVDVTWFRGAPTQISQATETDPFGPESCSIRFPKVTIFDRLGAGDLWWLQPEVDIDILWDGDVPAGYPGGGYAFEAYAASGDYSKDGFTLSMKGALLQLDNDLAKPEYLFRPLPYEWAIARQFGDKPWLRVKPPKMEFPSWWSVVYDPPAANTPSYLIPSGVTKGDKWTGLVTRATGKWEPALTNYVQSLLASLYTDRGRWTLDLDKGRQPVLRHRDRKYDSDATTLYIDPAWPGVDATKLTADWSQAPNAVFGQGTALSGEGYSGQQVLANGSRSVYLPLAALRQVHPATDENGWFQRSRMRKEVLLQLQEGLTAKEAAKVGYAHMQHFADPGTTGTITLEVDPIWGDPAAAEPTYLHRGLIKAGMTIHVPKLFGSPDGLLLHITRVEKTFGGSVTLTVDSKYRDALSVDEVRLRGRDAMAPQRMLVAGQYTPPIPDQLLPWNYAEGSGYIPSGPHFNAKRLFDGMPPDVKFPWSEWLSQRPPSDPSWRRSYIRIGPASDNANNNWASVSDRAGARRGFPIKMAQAGSVRLLQVVAVDAAGEIMAVPFHISFYYSNNVNYTAMPTLDADDVAAFTEGEPYDAGQHYPFFPGAWETFGADGTKINTERPVSVSSAGLIRAYGTGYVKAGFWPGASYRDDAPTGLLHDEGVWEFDTTRFDKNFDPYSTRQASQLSGQIYAMIYCDAQDTDEVFFIGRMFRVEPGAVV